VVMVAKIKAVVDARSIRALSLEVFRKFRLVQISNDRAIASITAIPNTVFNRNDMVSPIYPIFQGLQKRNPQPTHIVPIFIPGRTDWVELKIFQ